MSWNGSEVEHTYKNVWSPLSNKSLYSIASNIDPYLNYIFLVDIMFFFSITQKNESYFSEYIIII